MTENNGHGLNLCKISAEQLSMDHSDPCKVVP